MIAGFDQDSSIPFKLSFVSRSRRCGTRLRLGFWRGVPITRSSLTPLLRVHISDWAEMTGMGCVVIDKHTSPRAFRNEL
ncbi:hypothetical protein ACVLD2_001081 [Paenibacillus sp. PvR052]